LVFTRAERTIFSGDAIPGVPNRIEAAGAKSLCERDTVPLGSDIIHSVINPIDRLTGAIHIYGGDFFAAERSEWDSLTLDEHHSDGEQTRRMFERANARYEASLREGINEREFRPFDEVQVRTKPERGEYTP
jgi:hypothetical protein